MRLYLRTYCTCLCYLQLIYIVFVRHCFVLVCVVLWSVSAFSLTYSLTHSLTHWPLLSCITFTYFFFNRFVPYSPSFNLLLISFLNSLTPQLTIWLLPPWLPHPPFPPADKLAAEENGDEIYKEMAAAEALKGSKRHLIHMGRNEYKRVRKKYVYLYVCMAVCVWFYVLVCDI